MKNSLTIARKEIALYFFSPSTYVIIAVTLLVMGLDYSRTVRSSGVLRLYLIFGNMQWLFTLIAPLVTMRLLAEEKKSGTIETLLTCAVRDGEVVAGKFLASVFMLLVMLLPSFVYVLGVTRYFVEYVDYGAMLAGYLAVFLAGCLYLSVGLFASSLCRSQMVAAVIAITGLLMLSTLGGLEAAGGLGFLGAALGYIAVPGHFIFLANGLVRITDLVYFASFTAFFLFLTVRSLESRNWR